MARKHTHTHRGNPEAMPDCQSEHGKLWNKIPVLFGRFNIYTRGSDFRWWRRRFHSANHAIFDTRGLHIQRISARKLFSSHRLIVLYTLCGLCQISRNIISCIYTAGCVVGKWMASHCLLAFGLRGFVVAIAKDDIRQVLAETLNEMTVTVSPKINCLAWFSPLLSRIWG